jgi:hypothetical protein
MSIAPIRQEHHYLSPNDIIPAFLLFKKASGISPSTHWGYKRLLLAFFREKLLGLDTLGGIFPWWRSSSAWPQEAPHPRPYRPARRERRVCPAPHS